MKKPALAVVVLLAALTVLAQGCTEEGLGGKADVSISTDKQSYDAGEKIVITVSNNSEEMIHFGACNNYAIVNENGKKVNERECAFEGQARPLFPGQKLSFVERISEPGEYTLKARYGITCIAEYPLSEAQCSSITRFESAQLTVSESRHDGAFSCSSDSDCVKTSSTCCSCSMGGEETAVNRAFEQEYRGNLNCPADLVCPAVYACTEKEAKCVSGKCTLQ